MLLCKTDPFWTKVIPKWHSSFATFSSITRFENEQELRTPVSARCSKTSQKRRKTHPSEDAIMQICMQAERPISGRNHNDKKLIFVINQSLQRNCITQKERREDAKCLPQLEEADTTAARRERRRENTFSGEEWNMPTPAWKTRTINSTFVDVKPTSTG